MSDRKTQLGKKSVSNIERDHRPSSDVLADRASGDNRHPTPMSPACTRSVTSGFLKKSCHCGGTPMFTDERLACRVGFKRNELTEIRKTVVWTSRD